MKSLKVVVLTRESVLHPGGVDKVKHLPDVDT